MVPRVHTKLQGKIIIGRDIWERFIINLGKDKVNQGTITKGKANVSKVNLV